MKKLLWGFCLLSAAGAFWSCEDTPENPGDFSLKADLELGPHFVALSDPSRVYKLEEASRRDTTYKYTYTINDTLFEYSNDGKDSTYVYGPDGRPITEERDSFYLSKKTAVLIEMEPVYLESYADTVRADIFTNARWTAKQPTPVGAQWLYNYNTSVSGGGDSEFYLRTIRNRGKKSRGPVYQYVLTSDSMICIKIPMYQKGTAD